MVFQYPRESSCIDLWEAPPPRSALKNDAGEQGTVGNKIKLFRHSFCVDCSSTVRFIAVVIATAMSRDGDDFFFFSGDALNVLVPMSESEG